MWESTLELYTFSLLGGLCRPFFIMEQLKERTWGSWGRTKSARRIVAWSTLCHRKSRARTQVSKSVGTKKWRRSFQELLLASDKFIRPERAPDGRRWGGHINYLDPRTVPIRKQNEKAGAVMITSHQRVTNN